MLQILNVGFCVVGTETLNYTGNRAKHLLYAHWFQRHPEKSLSCTVIDMYNPLFLVHFLKGITLEFITSSFGEVNEQILEYLK